MGPTLPFQVRDGAGPTLTQTFSGTALENATFNYAKTPVRHTPELRYWMFTSALACTKRVATSKVLLLTDDLSKQTGQVRRGNRLQKPRTGCMRSAWVPDSLWA